MRRLKYGIYLSASYEAVERGTPKKRGCKHWMEGGIQLSGKEHVGLTMWISRAGNAKRGSLWVACYGWKGRKEGGWLHLAFYREACSEWVSISVAGMIGMIERGGEGRGQLSTSIRHPHEHVYLYARRGNYLVYSIGEQAPAQHARKGLGNL